MTRRAHLALAAVAAGALGAGAGAASAATVPVRLELQAFSPSAVDVLPGETVEWTNVANRRHTVTADDESFDSGDVFGGDRFTWRFETVGSFGYHCRVHAGMTGEIDVRRVTLGPLPSGLVPTGRAVDVDGRTATPTVPVHVERSTGGPFRSVATATPRPDGTWTARITAERTAEYRAVSGSDESETRQLSVSDRTVKVRRTKRGLKVRVVPAAPYARIALELDLRDRFGWWPAKRRKLDYLSEASFRLRGRARARVVLLADDGWTARAISRVVR
ncbi:MAG TPA: plastocyanin/azurin family copper-binding protein [Thermoleophilaceae bacterium]|nr:plastocyanin/azurin family copper-binding protein [Thermoleophilaceae bacterium]